MDEKERLIALHSTPQTFQKLSESDDGCPVTSSQVLALSFDKITEKYCVQWFKNTKATPCSADAVFFHEAEIYLIEFKPSTKLSTSQKVELKLKCLESILTIMDITGCNRDFARDHITYIVVYAKQPNSYYEKISNKISGYANNPLGTTGLGLGRLKGVYCKNVFTTDNETFEANFMHHCEVNSKT